MTNAFSEAIRILHVDDEPGFADLAADFLEQKNNRFTVETATSASNGLQRLASGEFDCIVSDYEMPGRNGIEFLEAVRTEDPDLPFILFTGKGSEEIASEAISAGVTDYLQKKSSTDQYTVLANRITNAAEHYRSSRLVEESENRLREIVDSLPHFLYVVDEHGTYLLANQVLAEFHGATVEEIEGATVTDVLGESAAEEFMDNLERVLEADSEMLFSEVEVADASGETHVFEPRLLPYEYGDTDSRAVLGIAADVTERKERELDLRRKERRYQAICEDPNLLIGLMDIDGTVLDVNQTAMEYVDAEREELLGEQFRETPWFDSSESLAEDDRSLIDRAVNGEYVEFEVALAGQNDQSFPIEGLFRPVTDDDGEVVSVIVSGRDITAQKEYEQKLERTTALRSTLFDTLPVGVLAEDESRTVVTANEQLFELFGMPDVPEPIGGKDCSDLVKSVSDQFVEPDVFLERIEAVVDQGEPVHNEELALRDGRMLSWSYRSVRLPEGDGHLWVFRDISDRQAREQRLETLNERTRDLMAAKTSEAVAEIGTEAAREILNLDANAIHLFDEERSGLVPVAVTDSLRDLIGSVPTFTGEDSIAWRVYQEGEAFAVGDVHDDPDIYNPDSPIRGELYLPLEGHGILIAGSEAPAAFDRQDVVLGEILASNIATALEQVERTEQLRVRERELTQQNERLEDFASVVSHDLRNPLQVAKGWLDVVAEECESDGLDDVDRALNRMDALISDLLMLARGGDQVGELQQVSLADLSRECWQNVETGEATIAIEAERTVPADRSRLQQLFENLIGNAVEHCRPAPDSQNLQDDVEGCTGVTVTVGDLDDGFYVADDGPGIPPDERETVFETGYSTSRDGTGFGLSIVNQVVDAHGWEITIIESEDGGARFEITGIAAD